jgi:hypothetical protein
VAAKGGGPVEPVLGVRQHVHNAAFRHPLAHQAIDQGEPFWLGLFLQSTEHGLAVSECHRGVAGEGCIRGANGLRELGLKVMDKLRRVCGHADLVTVGLHRLGIVLPAHQLVAIVTEVLAPSDTEIP